MLISKVPDEDGGKDENPPINVFSHEYQTANELFEMMVKNQNFNGSDGDTLTPRDLVLLYKNIDLGTKLMSNAKELTSVKTNQHVETVVYHEDPESDGSDISDIYSNEDMQNVYSINKERLDLLKIPSSVDNKLCHKFGDLEIQTTDTIDYNRHFTCQDPFIKEQLKNFNVLSNSKEIEASVLPASLLDYVCCKRLDDNYTFYMDNIIRYVKNTIEQLKRISNGDYLTAKAKEKWEEVEHNEDSSHTNTKVLATSTSIPLHVECKIGHQTSMWDDLVHSEVDIRSLSKILEKKIIVEVPKSISGSYKLLSKCCADNFIISCQKEQPVEDSKEESRVDVVFKLKRSETGHVVSNISSIMILQTAPIAKVLQEATPMALSARAVLYNEDERKNLYNEQEKQYIHENNVKITEIDDTNEINEFQDTNVDINEENALQDAADIIEFSDEFENDDVQVTDTIFNYHAEEHRRTVTFDTDMHLNHRREPICDFANSIEEVEIHVPKEASFNLCPDDLRLTMQKLSIQCALPEENTEDFTQSLPLKKKSPTRVRIKSPYENKSHAMEEKKRRKLLEIRQKREKRKMELAESCKVNKNKFGNRAPTPQASSSVTKLSITNKSFYNSIYGQSTDLDSKQVKNRNRRADFQKDLPNVELENLGMEEEISIPQDQNSKKFINRSYYLDDTVTEMMYLNMKQKEDIDTGSASTSGISADFRTNLNILSQLIPSDTEVNCDIDKKSVPEETTEHVYNEPDNGTVTQKYPTCKLSQRTVNIVDSNDPKDIEQSERDKDNKKIQPSMECRKSIDKIYKLMNEMETRQDSANKAQSKYPTNTSNRTDATADKGSFSLQGSDSGTSLKHHLTSSNPSTFSFDRNNNSENAGAVKRSQSPINVTPKVIISSKSQIPVVDKNKPESDKTKQDWNAMALNQNKTQEPNPLKAISQLLHEFENVQRNRLKSSKEQKSTRKNENNPPVTNTGPEGRTSSRQGSYKRRSRIEQHNEAIDRSNRLFVPKDRRVRQASGVDTSKIPYQQVPTDDRFLDKPVKKKMTDFIDEVKEARGEAVRGPSKFNSRLNSLAQPKRIYVQAHSEEYQNRYGRNLITDRLQRLAAAPVSPITERTATSANVRSRIKRHGNEAVSAVSLKLPFQSSAPIERPVRARHSTSNSPESKERASTGIWPSYKQANVAETPETLIKMIAVESYVKNHYGRASSSTVTLQQHLPQKSRAPLVPNDIDMGSVSSSPSPQESTEAGSKLHRIIDFMLKTPSCGLEVLAECHEPNSKSSKDNRNDFSLGTYRCDEGISVDSDFATGTTDDGIILRNKNSDAQSSIMNMEKIRHALCSTLSAGTFSKRMRMKNLGLTPNSSIQPLFLLQTGDTGSLVLNASVSEILESDKLRDLKGMPVLSKSNLNWSFTNIPMQIATVGYAFPEYNCAMPGTRLLEKVSTISTRKSSLVCLKPVEIASTVHNQGDNNVDKAHKDSQSYKGRQIQPLLERGKSVEPKKCPNIVFKTERHNGPNTKCNCANKLRNDSNDNREMGEVLQNNTNDEIGENKAADKQQDEKYKSDITSVTPVGVDNTTSFDILVGLLNEITKITTCQTHMTKNKAEESKELEFILNKTAVIENSNQSVAYSNFSLSNLERLRCLESNPSIYSLYLSDNEDTGKKRKINVNIDGNPWYDVNARPIYVDKEISVNIPRKECINKLTDVPSICFPITLNHSTDATNPLIVELCQTSTQSLFSYQSTYSDDFSKLIIPQMIDIKDIDAAVINEIDVASCCVDYQEVAPMADVKMNKRNLRCCGKYKTNKNEKSLSKYCPNYTGYDPAMKMKRDILVTFYSMLVFTVFAALSFPEMLFHV